MVTNQCELPFKEKITMSFCISIFEKSEKYPVCNIRYRTQTFDKALLAENFLNLICQEFKKLIRTSKCNLIIGKFIQTGDWQTQFQFSCYFAPYS